MNQNQIQQLTAHLSQALDQNYDVVNMEAVLSVICALEGTTITKEQLEATRLAKYINQLRRRTKNEHLARRAKSLLKKWREMVGIQQNVNESHQLSTVSLQQQQQQPSSSDFVKNDLDHVSNHLPLSPTVQITHPESQHSSDAAVHHHTSFSTLVNNVHRENKNIFRRHEAAAPIANTENEPAVVIDIASDSDEIEHNISAVVSSSKQGNVQNLIIANPIPIPSPSPRQKKLKKSKKHKDKDIQTVQGVNSKVAEALSQADSEIFSLSNSSMSSIFSAEATTTTLGNSQHNKQRLSASELTFTGRFKSVSNLNNNSVGLLSIRSNESSRKHAGKYNDDYNNMYDSSGASCSRLSPLNIVEDSSRKIEVTIDASMHQAAALVGGSNDLENTASQSRMHLPKKRGRKRGSKGVDSLIAKESPPTSLSQQIFFGQGSSTVKKVKTTKELFNEIQSRKLSVSTTSNLSNSSTTNHRAEQVTTMAAMFPRPTSSCSDTSIHSPQIMESYSGNVTLMGVDTFSNKLDAGNTDSDTVTSEPSRDSNKSQEIKANNSLDNSNNSNSFGNFGKSKMNLKTENLNDITTQLMHLIHSLKSPLSVYEIEQMYLSALVPCSCVIIEEDGDKNAIEGEEPENAFSDDIATSGEPKCNSNIDNNTKVQHRMDQTDILPPIERLDNDHHEVVENQVKPVRSIFDLDFDDDNDDFHTMMMLETKPIVKIEQIKKITDVPPNVSELVDTNNTQELEKINSETIAANIPIISSLIVQEDPNCLAKQRFYVQTNQVTSFHINALHNYYIPNINGNWDDIGGNCSSIQPCDSLYTVTDGADVVPKYASIASSDDRIKKDLSSLKFLKPFKAKPFKSLIAPFLGVAKYLPTCRRAAKRRRNISINNRLSQNSGNISINNRLYQNPGNNYNVPMEMPPLNVNIDVMDSSHNENNAVPIKILDKTSSSYDTSRYSVPDDIPNSNNLLKLVNDQVQLEADEIAVEKNNDGNGNGKNLNIKTSDNNSSSGSDSEDRNDNDYENNGGLYAIVQRPTTTSHDHIVLTIKKTPSKIHSPANTMINNTMTSSNFTSMTLPTTITTMTSPIITSNTEGNDGVKNVTIPVSVPVPLTKCQLARRLPFRPLRYRYRKRLLNAKHPKVDLDLKHIFNLKETSVASDITMREKLFFQHELCGENALVMKERLDYSSSDEDEVKEGESEAEAKNRSTVTTFDNNRYNLHSETDTRDDDKINSDDSIVSSSSDDHDDDIDGDDKSLIFQETQQHDLANNSLLKSFNSIQTDSQNDYLNGTNNKYCKNNNLETSTETLPLIDLEYRTGFRSASAAAGGYQDFKEWHQVLQLKSYNNEPLIVLPYVVLE